MTRTSGGPRREACRDEFAFMQVFCIKGFLKFRRDKALPGCQSQGLGGVSSRCLTCRRRVPPESALPFYRNEVAKGAFRILGPSRVSPV